MDGIRGMGRRELLTLLATVAALVVCGGAALAANKACPPGSTQANPCSGTTGTDLLIGTPGDDYVRGLAGDDRISGGAGNDTTDGGGGNDTYSYKNGWGNDALVDPGGGADHLNFSAVTGGLVSALLVPEWASNGYAVYGPTNSGSIPESVAFSGSATIEKVTGSTGNDFIQTGRQANTLRPGPGTGGATFEDVGGCTTCSPLVPASSDTYTGFAASGYGHVYVYDYGGTADKLILPFASTDAYFETVNGDGDPAADNLRIMTSATDDVYISGQLEPAGAQKGHVEQIQFTDGTIAIGGEARAASLNAASTLSIGEKGERSKAAEEPVGESRQR